jgi:prevent-host-death family protein
MYNINVHLKKEILMTSIPFTQARAHLADLIDQSKQGEKVFISQRGQTTAVLMSVPEYQKLTGNPSDIAESLNAWRENFKDDLSDSNKDFTVERDQSEGRDFSW